MSFTIEFIGDLGNQNISLITTNSSNLYAAATSTSVSEDQVGSPDAALTPATNSLTFDSLLESGNFTLQHSDINSNVPVSIGVNNVDVYIQNVAFGNPGITGVNAVYTLTLNSVPQYNYLTLLYNNSISMAIRYNENTVTFNGHSGTIQEVLDAEFGSGVWTVTGHPSDGTTITFTGPQIYYGGSPWSISLNQWLNSGLSNVEVTDNYTDGTTFAPAAKAIHALFFIGAFGGTFSLNSFSGIPWNIDAGTLAGWWSSNVASVDSITGTGVDDDPWIITYTAFADQSLPTIDGSYLVGFTDDMLQTAIGSNFIVTGVDPYVLTSITNGSGQMSIIASNDTLIRGYDTSDQPTTSVIGVTPMSASNGVITWDFGPDINQTGVLLTINTTNGSCNDLEYVLQGNDTTDRSNLQVVMNELEGGTVVNCSVASSVLTATLTGSLGNCAITSAVVTGGTNQPIITNTGSPEITGVNAIQSLTLHGATGGFFELSSYGGDVTPINYNIAIEDITAVWQSVTGKTISNGSGSGTDDDPWLFTFSEQAPESLPNFYGRNLSKNGTITNNFTDGTSSVGQHEIQSIRFNDSPTYGTWLITLNENTASSLDFNISGSDLQAELRSVFNISTILVTKGVSPAPNYSIDFGVDDYSPGSITVDGSGLLENVSINITEIQHGQS